MGFNAILYNDSPVESTNVISMIDCVTWKVAKPPSREYSAQKNLEEFFGTSPACTVELFTKFEQPVTMYWTPDPSSKCYVKKGKIRLGLRSCTSAYHLLIIHVGITYLASYLLFHLSILCSGSPTMAINFND